MKQNEKTKFLLRYVKHFRVSIRLTSVFSMIVILKTTKLRNWKYNLTYKAGVLFCLKVFIKIQTISFLCYFSILEKDESLQIYWPKNSNPNIISRSNYSVFTFITKCWSVLLNFSSDNQMNGLYISPKLKSLCFNVCTRMDIKFLLLICFIRNCF